MAPCSRLPVRKWPPEAATDVTERTVRETRCRLPCDEVEKSVKVSHKGLPSALGLDDVVTFSRCDSWCQRIVTCCVVIASTPDVRCELHANERTL